MKGSMSDALSAKGMAILAAFLSSRGLKMFAAWIVYLIVGTTFYTVRNGWPLGQGFYMSINVGYSIGWGFPVDPDSGSQWFSTVYVLVGSSFVVTFLGFFTRKAIERQQNWYVLATLNEQARVDSVSKLSFAAISSWITLNSTSFKAFTLWVLWVILGVAWSCGEVGWTFISGLYFSISSMSTGGLWAIPIESPDWYYGLVGAYAAVGVPIMGFAMGQVTSLIFSPEANNDVAVINAKVTHEELEMMKKFGMDNKDGRIERSEFVTLALVRLGVMTPDLLDAIMVRFDELDTEKDGVLTYAELLEKESDAEMIKVEVAATDS